MDGPANVMLIPDDCGHTTTPRANTMVQFSPRWVQAQAPAEGPSSVPHCQVTTLSTAPCRIDLATGLSRQGFSECGLCSHQEEWFGIGKFQVSDVAWTSACGGASGHGRSLLAPKPSS